MIDVFNIPNSQQDINVFYGDGFSWQTWQKPRNCQWVWMMAIGGGGGGAGGNAATTTNGSSAGASGSVTRAIFNASQLPDTLFIQVGLGGTGGDRSVNGSSGTRSFISILPNTTSTNGVLSSGANATATGGRVDGSPVGGEGAFLITTAAFGSLSTFLSTAGLQSQTGNVVPVPVNPLSSQITCPGQQGAAYNTTTPAAINGGSINSSNLSPLIAGGTGTIAASTDGGNGANGITSWKPFFSTGGAGGGNSRFGVGGNGGKGGIGSGGGAGGASGVTGAGGRGGAGGDGLVVIIAF